MRFRPGRPVVTENPEIVVDGGLRPGRHRFRLVVVDGSGQRSRPTEVEVEVVRRDQRRRGDRGDDGTT